MKRFHPLLALLITFAFVAAACGDDGDTASTGNPPEAEADSAPDTDTGEFPVTISSDAGEFTLESAPERIVSLSPTATEVLFAIGAGDQVVAVDEFSTFPDDAPTTDLSGFDPNVEAVIGFEPDLVVIANDANELVAGLTAVDVPVMISAAPATIEDGYPLIAELGVATGRIDGAAALVSELRTGIEDAFAEAPGDVDLRVYHELDNTFFSVTSGSFIGEVYGQFGLTNIADAADDGSGFPQLTEEFIIDADPQLIVITDDAGYTVEDVFARPGWDQISAVQNGAVVMVDSDIASRWGPRLPQFIELVAQTLTTVANA